jgi:hypothetical protein
MTLVLNTNIQEFYPENVEELLNNVANVDREAYCYSSIFCKIKAGEGEINQHMCEYTKTFSTDRGSCFGNI